jgi:hypothetical protein
MSLKDQPNPAPDLFQTFERLELAHRVEVREDTLHAIAKHFGWRVAYDYDPPALIKSDGSRSVQIGAWIDHRGSRWNPEPLTQGWSVPGTYKPSGPGPITFDPPLTEAEDDAYWVALSDD